MSPHQKEAWQYRTAVASFAAAVIFGLIGIIISPSHDIAAGVLVLISQFLLLTASIFGLDLKFQRNDGITHND